MQDVNSTNSTRNQATMTTLFRRINPAQKFRITKHQIAIACQLQKCSTKHQLKHLWNAIERDHTKHNSQYADSVVPFLKNIWEKCLPTAA